MFHFYEERGTFVRRLATHVPSVSDAAAAYIVSICLEEDHDR
jgi:hypothetical protein